MKPQIRELIEKATTIRYTGLGEVEEFDREKFAELLIRKCADFIAETARIETLLGDRLKDHFGVEE